MATYPSCVLGAADVAEPAIRELFSWLLTEYLPRRYPTMFRLERSPVEDAGVLQNLVTGEYVELKWPESSTTALKILGGLIDEDLHILLPDENGYALQGFVNCFANGPNTRLRLSKSLTAIHQSVPGYEEQLSTRMDAWFNRVRVGTFVKRSNVSYIHRHKAFWLCPRSRRQRLKRNLSTDFCFDIVLIISYATVDND
jgi:hypothetical protein